MGAVSMLLGKIDQGLVNENKLGYIADVILALSENPDAVTVNPSLLDEVWRIIDWYLKVDKGGFLLVLLNSDYWKKKDQIRMKIAEMGVDSKRIRLMQPALNTGKVIDIISSRDCRMVLYSKGCPKMVVGELGDKPSSEFVNLSLLKNSLEVLSGKVK